MYQITESQLYLKRKPSLKFAKESMPCIYLTMTFKYDWDPIIKLSYL